MAEAVVGLEVVVFDQRVNTVNTLVMEELKLPE